MSKKENNQLFSNATIGESLNSWCVTQQQSALTEASVFRNIPLSSTPATTTVSRTTTSYVRDHVELFKQTTAKLTTNEIRTVRSDDKSRNINSARKKSRKWLILFFRLYLANI